MGTPRCRFSSLVGDASVYCFDPCGEVVRWDNEANDLVSQKKSFGEVFEREFAELKSRKEKKKAGSNGGVEVVAPPPAGSAARPQDRLVEWLIAYR